ncbi:CPBP family intramembrane glutamic endopeptidase [Pseudoalteromonas arctica]|uniref:CPBP family intramembrane glutamic endopeptidase n=1 Tax=Pseudoalteromonas arctica TaxID=394751 RepID=UPI003CD0CA4E
MNKVESGVNSTLVFSSTKAYLFFVAYLCFMYLLYLNTDFLKTEIVSGKNLMNQYGFLESILLIALIGSIIEEFLFRYVLFKLLAPFNDLMILTLSSTLWAVLHFSENLLVPIMLFFLGWILGVLRIQTNSIMHSILVHFLNNAIFIFFLRVII